MEISQAPQTLPATFLTGKEEKVTEQKPAFVLKLPLAQEISHKTRSMGSPKGSPSDKRRVGANPQAGLRLNAQGPSLSQALFPEPLGKARCPGPWAKGCRPCSAE